jgi:hypothetical protein
VSTTPGLIIEPVALFTLAFLGLIDRISKVGDVYVAQHTLDRLHELQAKRTLTGLQTGSVGIMDGEFFFHKTDPDEIAKMNAALAVVTEWVEKYANMTGLLLPFTAEEEKWATVLGEADVASLAMRCV